MPPGESADAPSSADNAVVEHRQPSRSAKALWLGTLGVGTVGLIVETYTYTPAARRTPLAVLYFIAAMLVLQGLLVLRDVRQGSDHEAGSPPEERRREAQMYGWLLFLALSIGGLGLLYGTGLFLLAFLTASRPVRMTGVIAIVVAASAALYILFIEVLNLNLRSGWLI